MRSDCLGGVLAAIVLFFLLLMSFPKGSKVL